MLTSECPIVNYRILSSACRFSIALCSDDEKYGGHSRVNATSKYHTFNSGYAERSHHVCVYIPSR